MACVIISEKKLYDFGKRSFSFLKECVNNDYLLTYNAFKRLRILYFMTCQKVYCENKERHKERHEERNNDLVKLFKEKFSKKLNENSDEKLNEVWSKELDDKYMIISNMVYLSKKGDKDKKLEEIFNEPEDDSYTKVEFSLEEIYTIFDLLEDGVKKCFELSEDLFFDVEDFKMIYTVYKKSEKRLENH